MRQGRRSRGVITRTTERGGEGGISRQVRVRECSPAWPPENEMQSQLTSTVTLPPLSPQLHLASATDIDLLHGAVRVCVFGFNRIMSSGGIMRLTQRSLCKQVNTHIRENIELSLSLILSTRSRCSSCIPHSGADTDWPVGARNSGSSQGVSCCTNLRLHNIIKGRGKCSAVWPAGQDP